MIGNHKDTLELEVLRVGVGGVITMAEGIVVDMDSPRRSEVDCKPQWCRLAIAEVGLNALLDVDDVVANKRSLVESVRQHEIQLGRGVLPISRRAVIATDEVNHSRRERNVAPIATLSHDDETSYDNAEWRTR